MTYTAYSPSGWQFQAILAIWASIFGPLGERILAVADSNVAADNVYASWLRSMSRGIVISYVASRVLLPQLLDQVSHRVASSPAQNCGFTEFKEPASVASGSYQARLCKMGSLDETAHTKLQTSAVTQREDETCSLNDLSRCRLFGNARNPERPSWTRQGERLRPSSHSKAAANSRAPSGLGSARAQPLLS